MSNKNNAFTLIEVVVAIFIIALVIVGVFTLIQRTIMDRAFIASQLQASYLAQEGIELVRNQRDENWLNGITPWDTIDTSAIDDPITLSGKTFTRTVALTTEDDKLTVIITVNWTERGRSGNVEATSELYNWKYW